ncbi:MAG: formylmethanofuran dehydrogenase subunit C [Planctomycetes bacterium]|nr:formylmethanofuran dehydrogenase subunit C [Planctomycetota bacterium]
MTLVLSPATDLAAGGPLAIDLTGIVPDRLTDLSVSAIRRLGIVADERPAELGDLFAVAGDAKDSALECRGDFARVHGIAAGMSAGSVRVSGSVGRHAAEGMTGGRLEVAGDAGDWLAAEMAGGQVLVAGRAGDNVGAALPGSDHGMRGGLVVVAGDVGRLAGQRLRRGLVAVGGACGEAAAFEMRAGTVVVAGRVGRHAGLAMRRGSLVALADEPAIPVTFRRGRAWTPPFISLLVEHLHRLGFEPALPLPTRFRQWHGDVLAGGRGEILHPA